MEQKVKIGILWLPEEFSSNAEYFCFLTVSKNKKNEISYRQGKINKINIKNLEAGFSLIYTFFLERLSIEENQKFLAAIAVQQRKAGGSSSVDALLRASVEQHKYDQLVYFKTKADVLPLYHRVVHPETSRLTIENCRFREATPELHFEVSRLQQSYFVETFLEIEGVLRPLRQFNRFEFTVQHGQDWYLLKLKDARILEWLKEVQLVTENTRPANFVEKILLRLEKDYKVDRKHNFPPQEINVSPKCSIYLSELNDSFLVLMPKWDYENFSMEAPWEPFRQVVHKGVDYRIYREQRVETEFIDYVHQLHPSFAGQAKRGFYYLPFAEARKKQWFVKTYKALLENNVDIAGLDKLRNFKYSPFEADTQIEIINQTATVLVLKAKILFGKEEVPVLNIQKMLLAGQHHLLLKDDSIAVFSEEWQKAYALPFKHGVVEKNTLTLPPWIFLGEEGRNRDGDAEKEKGLNFSAGIISEQWRRDWLHWQSGEMLHSVPASIQATLRPYQQKGFEWLVLLSQIQAGACLADDMGLGKTLQTICFMAWQWERFPKSRCIVICPSSLIYNWSQEIQKYLPAVNAYLYKGQTRNWEEFKEGDYPLMVTSYSMIRQDLGKLKEYPWQVAVVDESHNIKNPSAQITRAVYGLNAINRVALSGTPVMNNTFDLYAQLQFLLPGLLGSSAFFQKEYVLPIDRNGDEEKIADLRKLTDPFILRRTKKQVAADLPEKVESILWCEMGMEQQHFYEEAKMLIKSSIFLGIEKEGLERSKLNILQGLQRLRQICDSPELVKDHEQVACTESIKIDQLMESLEKLQAEGNKALVFSQFTGMLHLVATRCEEVGMAYYHFDGSTPIEQRHEMVSAFQREDDNTPVFLISLKAGNAGLNLTAAQYVYLIDPWWNQAVEQQAIDRTHRIGQVSNVFAYRMICKDTIEEKILTMQQKKKKLSDDLISAEEGFVKNISEDELRYLFS